MFLLRSLFSYAGPIGEEIVIDPDLPKYVLRGSEEETNWKRTNPQGYKLSTGHAAGSTELHKAAHMGDADEVQRILKEKVHLVKARDVNGWMPLHVSSINHYFE